MDTCVKVKREYLELTAEYTHKFYEAKLTPSHDSGDISIRDPETGLIYCDPRPSATLAIPNWTVIQPDDILVFDIDGNKVWSAEDRFETVELPMHLAIYRAHPDWNSIVHAHPMWSACYAICCEDIPATTAEQALYIGGDVACAKYGPVGSWELANNVVDALAKTGSKAALLANHGAVTCGINIEEAFSNAEYLEHCAQTNVLARAMGGKIIHIPMDNLVDSNITL